MKFKGKSGIVLWLTFVFVLGCATCFVSQKNGFDSQAVFWILIVIYAAISIILVLFMVRNYIIVTDDEIKICLGFSTTVLKTASIVSMSAMQRERNGVIITPGSIATMPDRLSAKATMSVSSHVLLCSDCSHIPAL